MLALASRAVRRGFGVGSTVSQADDASLAPHDDDYDSGEDWDGYHDDGEADDEGDEGGDDEDEDANVARGERAMPRARARGGW